MPFVMIGIHFGQKRESTAICAAEIEERHAPGRPETHYLIRHLDRLPAGTSYPSIVDRIAEVVGRVRKRHGGTPLLYLNATGLGPPVVDLVRRRPLYAKIVDVYFNHGDRRTEVDYREVRLGKAYLVTRLQTLLQTNRVHLPQSTEARTLAEELLAYEVEVSEDANDRYGAFRVGTQDDLVTALGLALQEEGPRRAIILGG